MMWRRKFFRFLKEEGVYGEWVYNIYEQHPIWDKTFWECKLKDILSEEDKCENAIDFAFVWSDTIQGHDFWEKIDDEWIDKLRNCYHSI